MGPRGSVAKAKAALTEYEQANADLEPSVRRLMALACVGPKYKRGALETALGQELPRFPFRDSAWRWWNVLNLSGLPDRWEGFKDLAQTEGLRKAMQWLRSEVSGAEWKLFMRRAGQNPHNNGGRKPKGQWVWTKGGNWYSLNNTTKLLVLKQHLPPRPKYLPWHYRLGDSGVRKLEKELMHLIDPDVLLAHEAKRRAVEYVRKRMPELFGRSYLASERSVGWFFQEPLPTADGTGYIGISRDGVAYPYVDKTRRKDSVWSW